VEKIWLQQYPKGVPADIDVNEYASVRDVFEESVAKYASRPAYTCMGKSITNGSGMVDSGCREALSHAGRRP
jgi:long-chain acyl-CoA synthetase